MNLSLKISKSSETFFQTRAVVYNGNVLKGSILQIFSGLITSKSFDLILHMHNEKNQLQDLRKKSTRNANVIVDRKEKEDSGVDEESIVIVKITDSVREILSKHLENNEESYYLIESR